MAVPARVRSKQIQPPYPGPGVGEGFPQRRQLRLRDDARNRDVGRMHGDAAKGRERLARLMLQTDYDDRRGVTAPRRLAPASSCIPLASIARERAGRLLKDL